MSMNNEVAETLKALSENRNRLANIEDEKYNKAIAEQAARKKNYYKNQKRLCGNIARGR